MIIQAAYNCMFISGS